MIGEGQNVTVAFQNIGLFPPLVIRMLRVGENTGALDTALLNVAYFYNRDVKESIEKVQAMIEPAMTLILGSSPRLGHALGARTDLRRHHQAEDLMRRPPRSLHSLPPRGAQASLGAARREA